MARAAPLWPLPGHFLSTGPAGSDSGTTPPPPSLRAGDTYVLPGVSSRLTDNIRRLLFSGAFVIFRLGILGESGEEKSSPQSS